MILQSMQICCNLQNHSQLKTLTLARKITTTNADHEMWEHNTFYGHANHKHLCKLWLHHSLPVLNKLFILRQELAKLPTFALKRPGAAMQDNGQQLTNERPAPPICHHTCNYWPFMTIIAITDHYYPISHCRVPIIYF